MTVKRDFKRRVRQRQARTGESYVTARRRVLAGRPDAKVAPGHAVPDTGAGATSAVPDAGSGATGGGRDASDVTAAATADVRRAEMEVAGARRTGPGGAEERPVAGISVVELVDVSEEARRFGLVCRVRMFPALAERLPPARVLGRLRDILVATVDDPETAPLATLALTGQKPGWRRPLVHMYDGLVRFLQRARAGLGGSYHDGAMLAFHVADGDSMVPTLCMLSARETEIELSLIDSMLPPQLEPLAAQLAHTVRSRNPERALQEVFMAALRAPSTLPRPPLFVIHQERRHAIDGDEFVIGRGPEAADLVIDDSLISRRHAVVVRRGAVYYLADLGTASGILYKGVRITDKRIEEGDVFRLGSHELRFTFKADGY